MAVLIPAPHLAREIAVLDQLQQAPPLGNNFHFVNAIAHDMVRSFPEGVHPHDNSC